MWLIPVSQSFLKTFPNLMLATFEILYATTEIKKKV